MKNLSKLLVVIAFAVFAVCFFVRYTSSDFGSVVSAQTKVKSTPTPTPSPVPAPSSAAEKAKIEPATSADKTIPKHFTLSKDSLSEYGESEFNHDSHAFQKYSPDGLTVVGCVECHHTDQPKSALKLPLLTSEREIVLTIESWQKSAQKVSGCRDCHYQDKNEPEGKEMPTATYKDGDKETVKVLNNELAYHINCNTCHDAAVKLRPELKSKKGFATSKDCTICHKEN
jgi:Zn ribbon nucleic-acid-binding protein